MDIQPETAALGAGGSAAALRWFSGTGMAAKVVVWLTGCMCALVAVVFARSYYGLTSDGALGGIAFFSGLFGVLLLDKGREFLAAVNVGDVWRALVAWLRKALGLKDEDPK